MGVVEKLSAAAGKALDHALRTTFPQVHDVSPALLRHFRVYGPYVQGWRMTLPTSGAVVFVLQPVTYPARTIDIAVANRTHVGPRPHMFAHGVLCLAPAGAQHYPANHVQVSLERIAKADTLLSQPVGTILENEWTEEIRAYWSTPGCQVVSLLHPHGPSRRIVSVVHDGCIYVADTANDLRGWLRRRFGKRGTWDVESATLLWLDAPLPGPPFPRTYDHLLALTPQAQSLLEPLRTRSDAQSMVIIGWRAVEQTVLLGGLLEYGLTTWQTGYRSTWVAPLLPRMAAALPPRVVRYDVQRADAQWITFRGGRMQAEDFRNQRVAVLGCGSLGTGVAELLAKSGVGHLTLVDPELLTYDNIGRSTLGAEFVGQNKAEALRAHIERALPHIDCAAVPTSWMALADDLPSFDLTISTMAIWNENMPLNRIAIKAPLHPIMYAWLEPHALAAHAVCIPTARACIECGFTMDGRPKLVATAWNEDTRQADRGCGGVFQPYGAIDLAPAHALVAELALDTLGSRVRAATRRAALGNRARLDALGGYWSPQWEAKYGAGGGGRTVVEVPWQHDSACPACGGS